MSLLKRAGVVGRYPQFNNYVQPLAQLYGQTSITSGAGERVDEWTALGVSSVIAAVTLLCDTVASMPLRCYQYEDGKRIPVPVPDILRNPDPDSTQFEFIHQVMASMALHGNAYIHKDHTRTGELIGLVPLHPYQMQVLPSGNNQTRTYLHLGNELDPSEILHIRWFTPPQSLVGVSPLIQTRNLVGLSLAMDRHLAQWYAEGGTPSSVLETDQKLTNDQAQIIRNTWEATHRRHRKPAVLSDGLKWKPIQTSAADQQMIETREQFIRDIARVYRIPSHLIGATGDNQTYQNVEQASLNFLTHTIVPWIRRLETALSTLLPEGTDLVFDFSGLLRTDALTRMKVHAGYVMMGAENPNEVRVSEGMNTYEGGDVFNQALAGAVTAGGTAGDPLGEDATSAVSVMGVLE